MMRSSGHRPDLAEHVAHDEQHRHIAGLIGASRAPTGESRDWSFLLDAVQDQGQTESCVAQWGSSGLYLAGQAALTLGTGGAIPRPSRRWLYDVARLRDTFGVLRDDGCRPRQLVDGLAQHGIVAESRYGWDAHKINGPPPFDLDLTGVDALYSNYYRVSGDVPYLMRLALDQGHFPGVAIAVHEGFYDYDGTDVYDAPRGHDTGGSHMITLIGYRPGALMFLNSWGATWGAGGFGWLSDEFVSSKYVTDRLALRALPLEAEGDRL